MNDTPTVGDTLRGTQLEAKRLQNAIVKHRTETLLLYGDDYEGNEIDSDLWRFVVDD